MMMMTLVDGLFGHTFDNSDFEGVISHGIC